MRGEPQARTPWRRRRPWLPRPLADGPRAGRNGLDQAFGLGPIQKDKICFFELIFNANNNLRKICKLFQSTKNTQKITKNRRKFLELDWSMNNSNKVFGAHEKDFRAF
jgi:hypothetical protein